MYCSYSFSPISSSSLNDKHLNGSLRGEPHGLEQLVVRLNVAELRVEEQCLGIKFLSRSSVCLGPKGFASDQLLRCYSGGLRSQRQDLLRHVDHFPSPVNLFQAVSTLSSTSSE